MKIVKLKGNPKKEVVQKCLYEAIQREKSELERKYMKLQDEYDRALSEKTTKEGAEKGEEGGNQNNSYRELKMMENKYCNLRNRALRYRTMVHDLLGWEITTGTDDQVFLTSKYEADRGNKFLLQYNGETYDVISNEFLKSNEPIITRLLRQSKTLPVFFSNYLLYQNTNKENM